MLLRSRRRRGLYPITPERRFPSALRMLIIFLVLALALWWTTSRVLSLLGIGNATERLPAVLHVEGDGVVNVALAGQDFQRAQDGMKLFAGEKVSTSPSSHGSLLFFDTTWMRLDRKSTLQIDENQMGKEESTLSLSLSEGAIWIYVPSVKTFSGSITRTIATPILSFDVPASTQAVLSPRSVSVFSSDGEGILVHYLNRTPIAIGEGQKLTLPDGGEINPDLYSYRAPLGPDDEQAAFVTESRAEQQKVTIPISDTATGSGAPLPIGALALRSPRDGQVLSGSTVQVEGSVGADVTRVEVNGHPVAFNKNTHSFSQEIAPPGSTGDFEIHVEVFGETGTVLAQEKRTVKRFLEPLKSPAITSPAATGQTYRTNKQEIILRGTSPASATSIMVNDYQLQFFTPEKGQWSYVASTRIGNLHQGSNIFDVVAMDASGRKSDPARITILLGEGTEGVVTQAGSGTTQVNPSTLPSNAPLTPGILKVTGPQEGTSMTINGTSTGFLLEGTTSKDTSSIWVNDYRLQLYKTGAGFWNYIASPEFQTLKKGENTYTIVARNSKNEILDSLVYTVTYNP